MIRATSECSVRSRGESFKGALKRLKVQTGDSWSPGGSYKSWIENQVRLRAQLLRL